MAEIVIGTAGHVDHGKTALIAALTGKDTDRLPEEKRRGVSIDLGFAPFDLPSGRRAGIVDVPGHERFIKNMLAGVTGIDLVLLVVAADEGIMPQTREHLDILHLLGVQQGVVVITKIDLVDDEWLDLVEEELREELQGTVLAGAPVVKVSSRTGQGLDQLRQVIDELVPRVATRPLDAYARMPIDRVFTMPGFGTVITGTLAAGRLGLGEQLDIQPGDHRVRVRQLQVHGQPVETAVAGQRVAVNIAGADRAALRRGQVLVHPGSIRTVRLFAASVQLLSHAPGGLKNNARVRLHTGTSEVLGRCLLLDRDLLEPGEKCFMLFRSEADLAVARGDRFIIRSYSPMRTIGGGIILDPGRRYRRFRQEEIDQLEILERGDVPSMVALVLEREGRPMAVDRIAAQLDLPVDAVGQALAAVIDSGQATGMAGGIFAVHRQVLEQLARQAARILDQFHRRFPLRAGLSREELRNSLVAGLDVRAFNDLLLLLAEDGVLEVTGDTVRRAGFAPKLAPRLQKALEEIAHRYRQDGATPPSLSQLAADLDLSAAEIRSLVDLLVGQGRLVRISDELYMDAAAYDHVVGQVCRLISREGPQTVSQIRTALGTSRKYIVPLMEHLDQVQITRRTGDQRELTQRGREKAGLGSG